MQLTVVEYIAKKLSHLGIKDVFGLPGDFNFNILDAFLKSKDINWINCTNELNAAYAADGYARVNGYGALVTTYGVGELSAINGVAGSFAENVPVLHIAGVPSTLFIKNKIMVHHNFSDVNYFVFEKIYKNVTAGGAFLTKENAKKEIDRVIDIMANTKSPVYLAIPTDVCCHCIDDYGYNTINYLKSNESALNLACEKIESLLYSAKKPILFLDYLIKRFHLEKEVETFINKTGIKVSPILMGKGAISEDAPNFIGVNLGNFSSSSYLSDMKSSDLFITAGFLNSDLNTMGFTAFDREIDIKIEKTKTTIKGETFENVLIQDLIKLLAKRAKPLGVERQAVSIPVEFKEEKTGKISVEDIFSKIQNVFDENDIFVMETGLMSLSGANLRLAHKMKYLSQTLWGSIGWATPASFGAQVAAPSETVILFTGEGAHQLTIQEVANFFEYDLHPVIFVLNNGGYTIERVLSKDPMDKYNDITKWNYKKVLEGFSNGKSFYCAQIKTVEDFNRAINEIKIQKGKKLCYIEIFTEKTDYTKISNHLVSNMKHFAETL